VSSNSQWSAFNAPTLTPGGPSELHQLPNLGTSLEVRRRLAGIMVLARAESAAADRVVL
jgi:hypothetical protein